MLNERRLASGSRAPVEAFTTLTYTFGERTTASVAHRQRGHDRASDLLVQRSLPVGTGLGYRVQGSTGTPGEHGSALAQYQGPFGRYEAGVSASDVATTSSLGVAGGLVAIGGRVFATRPVQDSYALLRVPGVPDVRGYVENQEVGRTDRHGDLLIPSLRPFVGSRLGIGQEDVPMEHALSVTEQTVAAPRLSGSLVRFEAPRLRAFTGRVRVARGDLTEVPRFGTLAVDTGEGRAESPIGRDGEVYLDAVPPGRHPAAIESEAGRCRFELAVPDTAGALTDLGLLTCHAPTARP